MLCVALDGLHQPQSLVDLLLVLSEGVSAWVKDCGGAERVAYSGQIIEVDDYLVYLPICQLLQCVFIFVLW